MDVYGRLRVREYNTLHRAIRRSSWGPVRCNIALHLRRETATGYSASLGPEQNERVRSPLSTDVTHLYPLLVSFTRNHQAVKQLVDSSSAKKERTDV